MNTIPSKRSLFQYSFLAMPLAFAGLPLYIHAPDFYTRDLGMNVGLIGVILLAVRLFDAFQDPVIGYLSDKYARKRFLVVCGGVALLAVGMVAIFWGPQFSIPTSLWFSLSVIMATTGFSIVTINLNMIGGFWHDEPRQRTRISAWREAFVLIGLLIASVLPAVLQTFKPAEEAFRIMIWIFGGIIIVGFFMFSRFMSGISCGHIITSTSPKKGLSFLPILTGSDRHFFGVCFLTHLAAAMPGVMVLFFINDYLGAKVFSGLFLLLYFIAGAALMSVWVKLANNIGNEYAWLVSMFLAVGTFIWAFMLKPGDVIAYGVICVLSGMALGADLAMPPSIMADRVSAQKAQGEATQYYALLAFIPKIAVATASGLSYLILDHLGFVAGKENSPEAMQGLITLYALVPCLIKLSAAFYLWRMHKNEGNTYARLERTDSHGTYDIS